METLTTMYHWARASSLGDQFLPFSFTQMGASVEAAFSLVGEAVWKAFFGNDQVTDAEVCPIILRQVMLRQLMTFAQDKIKETEKSAAMAENAKKMLGEASADLLTKRRKLRNSPYGTA